MTADEILDVVVERGGWVGNDADLPGEYRDVRSELRALAKARGVRLLSSHTGGTFMVWWPDHLGSPRGDVRGFHQMLARTVKI